LVPRLRVAPKGRGRTPWTIMAPAMQPSDISLFQAALVGYQRELARIQAAIVVLQQRLGNHSSGNTAAAASKAATATRKRHRISPEGRARIAAAQRKRWAQAHRAADVARPAPAPAKRATAKRKVTHRAKAAKESVWKAIPKRAAKSRKQRAPQVPPAPVLVMAAEGQEPGSGTKG
jgi:hypothetical protein